jgi:acyl-[acyl-carrier-protein]-phospholipid O-acyltransferase/long-chain-fatty-acid--[acyl-carrier-protein] ligase
MRWFFRSDFRSFYLLNATQFFGAMNDNIFKLLVIYLLINVKGPSSANLILSIAGAVFVIPFLLFSSGAGILADRISKRSIIVFTKCLELVIMIYGLFMIHFEWAFGAYAALFFMATQSALFGPSKYGIIPELVEQKVVSKANGAMTSFTYLAIILGTFLASFLADITHKNFTLEAAFCVLIAVIGLFTSFGIRRTAPRNSPKKINPFFLYEIYQTLKMGWQVPHLLIAIYCSSFFLFIGAFTQLNIIPLAMQSLGLSEVGGGYLFLATAVGIAIGAVLSGLWSKDKVEPGISCLAGFFFSIFFFFLYFFSSSLTLTIISLGLMGICGGAYLIPFDAYLQINSPDAKRGQVIAAANFFSFIGVLAASFFLYLLSEELGLSAASGFALTGILSLISNTIVTGRLSALFLPFLAQKILKKFRRIRLASAVPDPSKIIILQSNSWWDAILLFACVPKLKILLPEPYFRHFPWINGLVASIRIIPPIPDSQATSEMLLGSMKSVENQNCTHCLFVHNREEAAGMIEGYRELFEHLKYEVVFAHGIKELILKKWGFFHFYQKQITMTFTSK